MKDTGYVTWGEFDARKIRWYERLWWRACRACKDTQWWFRHRFEPRHRYHFVSTGLPPGYYDPDLRLIHALFNETSRFVERTRGVVAWDADEGHSEAWRAFTGAAEWWVTHKGTLFDDPRTEEAEWREAEEHMMAVIENLRVMWYP
jgi:hypothetical protein